VCADACLLTAGNGKLGPGCQDCHQASTARPAQLPEHPAIDDGCPVDADEPGGVQPVLQRRHGLAVQVGPGAHVQLDVVVRGLDPVDLLGLEEDDPAAVTHHDA